MKKLIIVFSLLVLISCDENQLLESSGAIISKEISVGFFDNFKI
jgi:hypothetical protein